MELSGLNNINIIGFLQIFNSVLGDLFVEKIRIEYR
jgi:hypothetical protein